MSYMRDAAGRRLDSFQVPDAYDSGMLNAPPVATHPVNLITTQSDVGQFQRSKHRAVATVHEVRLVVCNYYIASGDTDPANAITYKAGLEYPLGTWYPVHWPNEDANRYVTINPGKLVISDPIHVTVPAGSDFYIDGNVAPLGGTGVYPVGGSLSTGTGSNEWRIAATTTDFTGSTPTGTNSAGPGFWPLAIIGRTATRAPAIGLLGDSIVAGTGDSSYTSWGLGENGWARRSLSNAFPYVCVARSSTTIQNYAASKGWRYSMHLMNRLAHVIEPWGRNDLTGSRTLAQIQADKITTWTAHQARGSAIWTTTITPSTSSTDTWATLGNQTPAASESVRVALNTWLRDGAPMSGSAAVAAGTAGAARCPVYDKTGALVSAASGAAHPCGKGGVIEVADTVESARNSGLWAVGMVYTTDSNGIHPSPAGHLAMAAAVPTSKFV